MWHELRKYSTQFKSAVLSSVDAEGYPYSVRCITELDESGQVVRVALANGAAMEPGRASLLYHQHDEQLSNLKVFMVRGRLERDAQGWLFYPERLIHGMGLRSPLYNLATMIRLHRTAKQYLRKRGLARPRICWEEVKALYPQTKPEQ